MGCYKCKKNELKKQIVNESKFVDKGVIWFTIIWSLFAIYGIYCFLTNIL